MAVRQTRYLLPLILISLIASGELLGGETLWLYAQGTDVRPKGTFEFKISNISRLGKDGQDYTFHDFRPEIEYGLTDRVTVTLDVLGFHHDYSVETEDLAPMIETQGGPGERFRDTQYAGFEASVKWNVLSPYIKKVGLSLGFEYERREVYRLDGAEIDQDSYVPILYLQKNFLDDTFVMAFKGKIEFELRKSPGVEEEEIAPDLALGLSYRLKPRWFLGWETRYQSDFLEPREEGEPPPEDPSEFTSPGNFRVGLQYQWAYYTGPTFHYARKDWWVTLGALWQVRGGGDESNPSARGGYVWDEHERVHVGLKFGFEF